MKRLSMPIVFFSVLGGLLILTEIQSCKHESITVEKKDTTSLNPNPSQPPGTTSGLDGATLYATNCASCHGALAASAKRGTTLAKIQNGIKNVSGMKSLSSLTVTQIQAITDALNGISTPTPSPTPSPSTTDGTTLYANNCASCHGALATSAKLGTTAAKIQNGINNVSGMKSLSILTSAQIQAIAAALSTNTSPSPTPVSTSDGATLYATNCASCHGVLASSSKLGATQTRIQNGINTVNDMKSLSSLTATQIQSISTALASTPMPTDGASLYSINCASCHGTLANSKVGSSSASKIQKAIKEKSQMKYLSTLTLTQIQAIAGALANIKGDDD